MALTQVKSDGIATGAVTATQIAANAVTVDDISDGSISTAKLADSAVTNAKVDASAAIAGTKISPDFGSQNIVTTGTATISDDLVVDTDTLFVDASTDRVGIGTSSPGQPLHLNAATGNILQAFSLADSVKAYIGLAGSTNGVLSGSAANDLCFRSESANIRFGTSSSRSDLSIDSSGRVGIGTTSITGFSDYTTVQVGSGSSGAAIRLTASGDTAGTDDFVIYKNTSAAYLRSFADPLAFHIAGNERARIDSSGRLLVGTSSGTSAQAIITNGLQVTGAATDANTSRATLDYAGSTARLISHYSTGSEVAFYTNEGGSGATERFRIGAYGQWGLSGANYGTSGQVLTSQGSGAAPQWATPSGLSWTTHQQNANATTVLLQNVPSSAEQIIIAYNELSTASTADQVIYLGDSGGIETTGYYFTWGYGGYSNGGNSVSNGSSGFFNSSWNNPSNVYWGTIFLTKAGGNFWNIFWRFNEQSSGSHGFVYGGKATSSALTQVRFMPSSGNWDAGQVRFKYLA